MKKSELKAVLKPIIEECLRESFVENGFLGKVITEVIRASNEATIINEQRTHQDDVRVFPQVVPDLPKKSPSQSKFSPAKLQAAKALEDAGYFQGINFSDIPTQASAPKSTIVEGINVGVLPIDEFANQPGLPEDTILKLMGKK